MYERLLHKLASASDALQGKVFAVLGALFEQTPLRTLLVEAIRYGDRPDVQAKWQQQIDQAVDQERIREVLETEALETDTLDTSQMMRGREDMERYAARRLQSHYIESFFRQAFEAVGGVLQPREPGRFHISYVPARIRQRAKELGTAVPVWGTYDPVCFEKKLLTQSGAGSGQATPSGIVGGSISAVYGS